MMTSQGGLVLLLHAAFIVEDVLHWGRALVLAGVVSLCRQPSNYALYNRPI